MTVADIIESQFFSRLTALEAGGEGAIAPEMVVESPYFRVKRLLDRLPLQRRLRQIHHQPRLVPRRLLALAVHLPAAEDVQLVPHHDRSVIQRRPPNVAAVASALAGASSFR